MFIRLTHCKTATGRGGEPVCLLGIHSTQPALMTANPAWQQRHLTMSHPPTHPSHPHYIPSKHTHSTQLLVYPYCSRQVTTPSLPPTACRTAPSSESLRTSLAANNIPRMSRCSGVEGKLNFNTRATNANQQASLPPLPRLPPLTQDMSAPPSCSLGCCSALRRPKRRSPVMFSQKLCRSPNASHHSRPHDTCMRVAPTLFLRLPRRRDSTWWMPYRERYLRELRLGTPSN